MHGYRKGRYALNERILISRSIGAAHWRRRKEPLCYRMSRSRIMCGVQGERACSGQGHDLPRQASKS